MEPRKGGTPKSFLSVPPLQGLYLLLHPTQGYALGYFMVQTGNIAYTLDRYIAYR